MVGCEAVMFLSSFKCALRYLVWKTSAFLFSSKTEKCIEISFFLKDPIYLQFVIIHSANGGKGEGWRVEEYSVALLC
jgi:hypothetical protein